MQRKLKHILVSERNQSQNAIDYIILTMRYSRKGKNLGTVKNNYDSQKLEEK